VNGRQRGGLRAGIVRAAERMAGLSRDILKWLQSLDLSYSVKNVKRDFANGFLVAEIFSRYFPHDVQMHSFDNGISLPKKLANWELLEKFFLKKRVPIGRDMIDLVIHCKGNAALPLLETIYTCLTSKKVQNVRAKNDDQLIPPFARATASFEIKQNIKESELLTTLQDENTGKNRSSELLNEHSQTLRDERLLEPGRFTAVKQQRSSQRVPPRPMQAEVPTGQIEFKEVQVRTLDKQNITQLRASRGVGADRSASMAEGADQSSFADHQGGEIAVKSVRAVTAILNPCVDNDMMDKLATFDAELRDPIISMVDALAAKKMDDEEGGALLASVKALVPELVESFLASPMELWRFLHIFTQLLNMPDQTQCYDQTVDLLCNVGYGMMNHDAYVASGLFMEYGLPKMVGLLSSRPTKRRRLLEMAYSFCSQQYHLKFIKAMQDSLQDMQTFLHCIVVLMHLEKDFTEDLLDLYLYYAMVGLGQQSGSTPSLSATLHAAHAVAHAHCRAWRKADVATEGERAKSVRARARTCVHVHVCARLCMCSASLLTRGALGSLAASGSPVDARHRRAKGRGRRRDTGDAGGRQTARPQGRHVVGGVGAAAAPLRRAALAQHCRLITVGRDSRTCGGHPCQLALAAGQEGGRVGARPAPGRLRRPV